MSKKKNMRPQDKQLPGEFKQTEIVIGKDNCRSSLQYYYACGGYQAAFAEFKGKVIQIDKNKGYLFKRLYICFEDPTGIIEENKEDHVWIYDAAPFKTKNIKVGDCISFTALVYAYRRQDGTEDYSLKSASEIEVIDKYELPSDESIQERALSDLVCETCLYASQCYGEPCLAPDGYKEERIQWLKQLAKDIG